VRQLSADFAFAELLPHDRIALLDSLLAQLSADQVRVAVNDPESLGVLAEARLIGLERSDEAALRRLPYTFPSAAASPVATAVSTGSLWSTGRVDAPTYQQCYSQAFTLAAGTYYFGDLDYYNLSNFRDVLIVATPTPAPKVRHAMRARSASDGDLRQVDPPTAARI
jgi:hypothetical protein